MRLSREQAGAMLLAAQGLLEPRTRPAVKEDVLAEIRRMGLLQIDTISVVARSQHLVLFSRLGDYRPEWLEQLHAEGKLFEYWAHAACFLPIEQFRLYRRLMLDYAQDGQWLSGHSPEQQEVVGQVLERIRTAGAVRSSNFGGARPSAGWWDRKPEKRALEHLFYAGALMIARREGFQRIYDLQERVLPGWDDTQTLSPEEMRRALTLTALRALGIARLDWVLWYFHDISRARGIRQQTRAILDALVEEGVAILVEIEGAKTAAYVHAENRDLLDRAAAGALQSTVTTFLSPFDPVVSDRARARELFEFDYTIEVYTPAPRRKYGYFTLPILHRGTLIGRLDPKAHRKEGIFELRAVHLEPDAAVTDELVEALAGAIRRFAAWHQTPEIAIRESNPPELAERLRGAV